jgi:hypothetical protein
MSATLRWMLILGCLMLAVLEAPRSSALVVEDLAGPYAAQPAAEVAKVEAAPQALLARSDFEADVSGGRAHTGTK